MIELGLREEDVGRQAFHVTPRKDGEIFNIDLCAAV